MRNLNGRMLLSAVLILAWGFMLIPFLSLDLVPWGNDNGQYYLRALALHRDLGYEALEIAGPHPDPIIVFGAPPLLPFLLSLPMYLFGEGTGPIKVWFYLLQLGALGGVFLLYRKILGQSHAMIGIALLALSPLVMFRFPIVLTDILNLGLCALTLILMLRLSESSKFGWKQGLVIGISFGIMLLLRFGNIGWVLAGGVWLLIGAFVNRSKDSSRVLIFYIAGVALIGASLLSWIYIQAPDFFQSYLEWHNRKKSADIVANPVMIAPAAVWLETIGTNLRYAVVSLGIISGIIRESSSEAYMEGHGLEVIAIAMAFLVLILIGIYSTRKKYESRLLLCFMLVSPAVYLLADSRNLRYFLPFYMIVLYFIIHAFKLIGSHLARQTQRPHLQTWFTPAVITAWALLCMARVLPGAVQTARGNPAPPVSEQNLEWRQACKRVAQLRPDIAGKFPDSEIILSDMVWLASAYSGMRSVFYMREIVGIDSMTRGLAEFDRTYLVLNVDGINRQRQLADPPVSLPNDFVAMLQSVEDPGILFLRDNLTDQSIRLLDSPGSLTGSQLDIIAEDLARVMKMGASNRFSGTLETILRKADDPLAGFLRNNLSPETASLMKKSEPLSGSERFRLSIDLSRVLRERPLPARPELAKLFELLEFHRNKRLYLLAEVPMEADMTQWYNMLLLEQVYAVKLADLYDSKSFYFDLWMRKHSDCLRMIEDVGPFGIYEIDGTLLREQISRSNTVQNRKL